MIFLRFYIFYSVFVSPVFVSLAIALSSQGSRITDLLESRYSKIDGPNCYNSALYALGISSGLYFSTNEIDIWLNSPLCKNIEKSQIQKGDLISFNSYGSNAGHIITAWTNRLGFNKTNGSASNPYELVDIDQATTSFYNEKPIPVRCFLIKNQAALRDSKCINNYTTLYRCENPTNYFSEYIKQYHDVWMKFERYGELLNQYFLKNELTNAHEIRLLQIELSKLAKSQIQIPSFHDLSDITQVRVKEGFILLPHN